MATENIKSEAPRSTMYLERDTRSRRIDKIAKAAEKESWGLTLIQLAWTAGPAAFIALQSGYILGFGHTAPVENIIYLTIYTLIAGIIGLIVRTYLNFNHNKKQKEAQRNLILLLDRLPELIISTRDLALAAYDPILRKQAAASSFLRSAAATPEAIELATFDLTQNKHLADMALQIETFRQAGMSSRVRDIVESNKAAINECCAQLKESAPEASILLKQRLNGHAPSLKEGVPRKEGFIERIILAAETDNRSLMSLRDAEEILTLIFELLIGRKILMLSFRYRGRRSLTEAADALEAARNKYGIAIANFHSRLHNLINFLIECGALEISSVPEGLKLHELVQLTHIAINDICEGIKKLQNDHKARNKYSTLVVLSIQTDILSTTLELYQSLRRTYRHIGRRQELLATQIARWANVSKKYNNAATALRSGRGQGGLRIIEQKIHLDDKEKLELARSLAPHVYDFNIHPSWRISSGHLFSSEKTLDINTIKEIAIEAVLALEEFIPLSNPSVRYAIESANAINLDGFRLELNAITKTEWGAAFIHEVPKDVTKAAEHLARVLTQHYGVSLTSSAIDFLHHTYGVSKEIMEELNMHPRFNQNLSGVSPEDRIPFIMNANRYWIKTLERAKTILKSA